MFKGNSKWLIIVFVWNASYEDNFIRKVSK